jgi:uncharacterized membrane protein
MKRIFGLSLFLFFLASQSASAAVCFGAEQNAEVFINVEICPANSQRECAVICLTPDVYETEAGALTMARFIVAVGDGEVAFDHALAEARKKFGTGRSYEIGNVTVEPQLCRNRGNTKEIACDF